ncbi:MAG: hypothetical protein AMXMBFR57_17670 [Acidimicrobiia bacterium]
MSNERPAKYEAIVRKLIVETEAGRIAWEVTPYRNRFLMALDSSSIAVESRDDLVQLLVLNSEGTVIDTVEENSMPDRLVSGYSSGNPSPIRVLYDAARRSAYGVEATLDSIIEQLDTKQRR